MTARQPGRRKHLKQKNLVSFQFCCCLTPVIVTVDQRTSGLSMSAVLLRDRVKQRRRFGGCGAAASKIAPSKEKAALALRDNN